MGQVLQKTPDPLTAAPSDELSILKARIDALETRSKSPSPIRTNILLQQWFMADQHPGRNLSVPLFVPNQYRVRRAELRFSGDGAPGTSWFICIDPARALYPNENTPVRKSILKDIGIVWTLSPGHALSWYQGKVPFGLEGLSSSGSLLFIERSVMATLLGWSEYRDLGIKLSCEDELFGHRVVTELGAFQGEGPNAADTNYVKDIVARILIKTPLGLDLGVSRYEGRLGSDADYTGSSSSFNFRSGYELVYALSDFSAHAEYASGNVRGTGKQTAYADTAYRFLPQMEAAFRYDWAILNDTVWDSGQYYEATAGINYFFDANDPNRTKLQVNGVASGAGHPFETGNDLQARINFQVSY